MCLGSFMKPKYGSFMELKTEELTKTKKMEINVFVKFYETPKWKLCEISNGKKYEPVKN